MGAPLASLVVISYEMARELPRTLLSLSPGYQRGCLADEYEIVVVDNGSRSPPEPGDFTHLHADLSVVRCPDPSPSPVRAINLGLGLARGTLIGVWIDGARMASPGLLRACLDASALHPRAIVATMNYQLGPKRQLLSAEDGYDQAAEDGLLAGIAWPEDGYRLFEISAPEMRAPTAPMLESNALFMPSALWEEVSGYDEAFREPGGGLANPDVLVRAVGLLGTQLIRIVGEGTFHQMHGGLSTSSKRGAMAVLKDGSRRYFRLRGKPLAPVRSVGWLYDSRLDRLVSDATVTVPR